MKYDELLNFLQNIGKDPSRVIFEDEFTGTYNRRCLLNYFCIFETPQSEFLSMTYDRWSYSPASEVFVVVNSVDRDAFAFRLTSSGGTPPFVGHNGGGPQGSETSIVKWR